MKAVGFAFREEEEEEEEEEKGKGKGGGGLDRWENMQVILKTKTKRKKPKKTNTPLLHVCVTFPIKNVKFPYVPVLQTVKAVSMYRRLKLFVCLSHNCTCISRIKLSVMKCRWRPKSLQAEARRGQ